MLISDSQVDSSHDGFQNAAALRVDIAVDTAHYVAVVVLAASADTLHAASAVVAADIALV
ncbi:MAG: hypothetical protein GX451_03555 [Acholeplasmataceae bacterium]|nr:hypothetical protein [Acholeplasmataceae bacterium]